MVVVPYRSIRVAVLSAAPPTVGSSVSTLMPPLAGNRALVLDARVRREQRQVRRIVHRHLEGNGHTTARRQRADIRCDCFTGHRRAPRLVLRVESFERTA